ncbi:hypothetical protein Droror1_Dr00000258 [Drosera rotundifolia]
MGKQTVVTIRAQELEPKSRDKNLSQVLFHKLSISIVLAALHHQRRIADLLLVSYSLSLSCSSGAAQFASATVTRPAALTSLFTTNLLKLVTIFPPGRESSS